MPPSPPTSPSTSSTLSPFSLVTLQFPASSNTRAAQLSSIPSRTTLSAGTTTSPLPSASTLTGSLAMSLPHPSSSPSSTAPPTHTTMSIPSAPSISTLVLTLARVLSSVAISCETARQMLPSRSFPFPSYPLLLIPLQLTIQLDFVSGQTSYIPPPLPKAEILNGLSAYLQVSRTPSSSSTPPTDDPIPPPPPSIAYPTTESLIEAIFNPVQIGDHSTHSPFTLYVPPPLNLSSSSTSSASISSSSISNSNKL